MGTGTSTLPREELLVLFDKVDADKSGTLDHAEVQALCQLLWEKEKQSGKIPNKVGNSVFQLLDSDGDGIITHDEFELLVEEVYNDRSHIIEDAGVKLGETSSWLGFLGISQQSKPEDDDDDEPTTSKNDVDPDAIIEAVKPTKSESKPRKVRPKKEDSEESEKSEQSPKSGSEEQSSKSSSESESVHSDPPPRKSKKKKPPKESSSDEEPAPAIVEAPPESSSWLSNLFSSSPADPKAKTADKAVDQESRSFWQSWTESKPEPAPPATLPAATREVPEWPATNGPGLTMPSRLLPLNQFLLMQQPQSLQRRAIELALEEEETTRYVRIRPWPSEYSPAWESYAPFRMRR